MTKHDIVIIGSGLGGLLCGYILSKEGYDVCVVEKNKQIGGCLQSFVRDRCIFSPGLNYTESLDEGQILYRYFKYFDLIGKLKLKKLDEDGFDKIIFDDDDQEYKHAMGHDNFVNTLLQSFPKEKQGLIKYVNKLKEVSDSFPLYHLREVDSLMIDGDFLKESTTGFLKSVTSNVRLQNVLAGTNSLYAGVPDKTPLYIHALINNSFIQSAWKLVDGSFQIAKFIADSIVQHGGTVLRNREAKKFIPITRDKKLRFVELADSQRVESKYFISNVHPAKTLEMIEPGNISKIYRNRIINLENTMSMFILNIVLKKDTFPYLNSNYHYYKNNNVWTADYIEKSWPESYLLVTPASSKSDVYADCIAVITYMKYDELRKWENTTIEKRGDDYLEFKRNKAEKLLDLVERKFPGLRKNIKAYYTSTPLTFRDYTGTVNGSAYGILKDYKEPFRSIILPRTKIPNLFFTGQNLNLHGILGVTIGSVLTCSEFVGLKYLIRKIKNV
ncbi:MAG: NAD(P)-binding protein [Bacteroidota bacterium]